MSRASPAADANPLERVGELDDALFVGAAVDDRALAAFEHLFQGDDLARLVALAVEDDAQGLVQHDLFAAAHLLDVDLGVHRDAHLAAAGEHVDRAVVVGGQERAVCAGRLGELVDLFAKRRDVLLRLLEREGQLLVLGDGLGQLALRLEQPLFEGLDPARALAQSPPEGRDLFLRAPCTLGQLLELAGSGARFLRPFRPSEPPPAGSV